MQEINFKNLPKQVVWPITSKCNYDCSYCFMKKGKRNLSVKSANLFLRNIEKKLDKNWGFVITGGEPFLHKSFFEIVKGLTKLGHQVSIFTNFSVDPQKIIRFLKLTGDKCGAIFASLHLEHTTPDNFLKKILIIEKSFPSLRNHLFVTSVATNKALPRLEKIKKKFFEKGCRFFIRPYQYPDHSFFSYSGKQKKIIERISKKYNLGPFQKQLEFRSTYGVDLSRASSKGQRCWAGCLYFWILADGAAFRCCPFTEEKLNYIGNKLYMGNILRKDFKLLERATKCQRKVCIDTNYYLKSLIISER